MNSKRYIVGEMYLLNLNLKGWKYRLYFILKIEMNFNIENEDSIL